MIRKRKKEKKIYIYEQFAQAMTWAVGGHSQNRILSMCR